MRGAPAATRPNPPVFVGVLPGPRREDAVLIGERTAGMEVVALQHGGGVAEDEVNGALS